MADSTKERLAQRRAQEHAENLAAETEARSAALEQIGQKLGAALDHSQGIPLGPAPAARAGTTKAPKANPNVAPKPPSITRAEEEQLSKDEAEAERLAYEEELRASGVPVGGPANPADFQSRKPLPKRDTSRVQHKKVAHPLLSQLRAEFGVGTEQRKSIDVKVAEHIWTFIPLTPDMIALAARSADVLSETIGEHALRAKQAAVCFSIVAVDTVPVWLMLGMEASEHDNVDFPLIPKGPLRRNAALALYSELTDNMKNRLMDALYEAYVDKVDPKGEVASYLSYEKIPHVAWVCSEPDCEHKLMKPRHYDANNEEQPYYCEIHGVEMLDMETLKPRIDEDLRPLV